MCVCWEERGEALRPQQLYSSAVGNSLTRPGSIATKITCGPLEPTLDLKWHGCFATRARGQSKPRVIFNTPGHNQKKAQAWLTQLTKL